MSHQLFRTPINKPDSSHNQEISNLILLVSSPNQQPFLFCLNRTVKKAVTRCTCAEGPPGGIIKRTRIACQSDFPSGYSRARVYVDIHVHFSSCYGEMEALCQNGGGRGRDIVSETP